MSTPRQPPGAHVPKPASAHRPHQRHVRGLSERGGRRAAAGRHPAVGLGGERRRELQRRGAGRRAPDARQAAQDGVAQGRRPRGLRRGGGGRSPAGGQTGAEECGQRAGEGPHARAVQGLLETQDVPAVGAGRHQAVQAGHSAPGVQLHRAPQAGAGQRQVRERIRPPRQPDVALHGRGQARQRVEGNAELHALVRHHRIVTQHRHFGPGPL